MSSSPSTSLKSANPDPSSWLFRLVEQHNTLQSFLSSESEVPLISQCLQTQALLKSFYTAMLSHSERAKCDLSKIDGTTPPGLGGKTGVVKNAFTVASLLDAICDTVRDQARKLEDVHEEMKAEVKKLVGMEMARDMAVREGLVKDFEVEDTEK
ncbi:hypothetical protein HII31_03162 [Pseudocercospora fuligena]|uniref:Uncharacterized protein n=1 Tax=Pseudocercospora fuligena TaxID=685502 RepID=A0A8H6VK96_9PEZI|nr:hypothetical protein HII31_03162 [Pseudocercospora fuligena]